MISVNIAMGLTVWDRSAAYWKSNHFIFPCAAVTLLGASICVYVCMNMFTSYKNLFTSNKGAGCVKTALVHSMYASCDCYYHNSSASGNKCVDDRQMFAEVGPKHKTPALDFQLLLCPVPYLPPRVSLLQDPLATCLSSPGSSPGLHGHKADLHYVSAHCGFQKGLD